MTQLNPEQLGDGENVGEMLVWNGNEWVRQASSPSDGQVLQWNDGESQWAPKPLSVGGITEADWFDGSVGIANNNFNFTFDVNDYGAISNEAKAILFHVYISNEDDTRVPYIRFKFPSHSNWQRVAIAEGASRNNRRYNFWWKLENGQLDMDGNRNGGNISVSAYAELS